MNSRTSQLLLVRYGGEFAVGTTLWLLLTVKRSRLIWLTLALGSLEAIWEIAYTATQKTLETGEGADMLTPVGVWITAIVIMVIAVRLNTQLLRRFPRISGPARHLGLITYPLYLTHATVGAAVIGLALDIGAGQLSALLSGCLVAVATGSAVVSIEPFLRRFVSASFEKATYFRQFERPSLTAPTQMVAISEPR
jgi:peptidoglycan/LPS O-acetylase OafA/YrhL